jgi:hypothetical protein
MTASAFRTITRADYQPRSLRGGAAARVAGEAFVAIGGLPG